MVKHLTDPFITPEEILAWRDPRQGKYDQFRAHALDCLEKLKRATGPAASYSRTHFKAELKRVDSLIAERDRKTPELEAAREAYRVALANVREHNARSASILNVEEEIRSMATRNVLGRLYGEAKQAFIDTALSSQLPPIGTGQHHLYNVLRETAELAEHALKPGGVEYIRGYSTRSLEVAEVQGRAAEPETAIYFAVAEYEWPGSPEAKLVFDLRWFFAARKLGLEVPPYPLSNANSKGVEASAP